MDRERVLPLKQQIMACGSIQDYSPIGDMTTCAMVKNTGNIDFMCWPKFDSPTIFARILDTSSGGGGHWSVKAIDPTIIDHYYVEGTNTLQTEYNNIEGAVNLLSFFGIRKHSNVQKKAERGPVLIRKLDCTRGTMTVDVEIFPQPNYATGEYAIEIVKQTKNAQRIVWTTKPDKATATTESDDATSNPLPIISVVFIPADGQVNTAELFEITGKEPGDQRDRVRASFVLHKGEKVIMQMSGEPDPDLDELEEVTERREKEVNSFWKKWVRQSKYRGRYREIVERSLLVLKLLTYEPTGAIVASPTFSLPERIGGSRNWDYRYSWVRDSSFTVYVFLKMGFAEEAEAYMNFIFARMREWQVLCEDSVDVHLPLMFTIDGATNIPESELPQFGGYLDSKPVRIGNAATDHVQLDIYGELMDSIYLFNKHVKPLIWEQWKIVCHMIDFVCAVWDKPDNSIWEVRGVKENFVYSKIMLWVAVDRGLRLAGKVNFPTPNVARWSEVKTKLCLEIMQKGFNEKLGHFIQSYESNTTLDAALLIAPLVFFVPPTEPRFLATVDQILKAPEDGGLTTKGMVHRYNTERKDDGVGGEEGTFIMCTLWMVEALARAGKYEPKYLSKAQSMFHNVAKYSNPLRIFSEEASFDGEQLGNCPQAFSHLAFISAAFNLQRVIGDD